jgi:hypothetical protein
MLANAIRLAALLALLSIPAFADVVMGAAAGQHAPAPAANLERTAAERAEILAGTDYTWLGTCQGLVRDLSRWGVLDNLATGIAFGLINNTSRIARRAEAIGNHRLQRGSAEFVIGLCTATMHIHMANRDGAKDVPRVVVPGHVTSSALQRRIARLQSPDAFDPDRCRAHIGKLEDADVIDDVADVMLRLALEDAIEQGAFGTPGQDPGQGFGHGLCAAVLNAVMGAP